MEGQHDLTAETAELRGGRPRPENAVGESILGCAIAVHKALGPGLLENAYEACLAYEFAKAGIRFRKQLTLPVIYDGHTIDLGYRLDFLVEEAVVIEVKAIEAILPIHRAQLLSYLKLGRYRLGYLMNFSARLMREGVTRLANGL